MAGPVVIDPARRRRPQFGTAKREDIPGFLGIMQILHSEPNSSMFARLLEGKQTNNDEVPLAHLFEEISTLALHGLVPEDLLFDAYAFDDYWEKLSERVQKVRKESGNEKFCENFELAAASAIDYREDRPAKHR